MLTGRLSAPSTVRAKDETIAYLRTEITYREALIVKAEANAREWEGRTDAALKVMDSHTDLLRMIDRDITTALRGQPRDPA